MNKLIFVILFTFVSSISFSKEITLNCKFLNGQIESKFGEIDKELQSVFKKDILFKFDETKKFVVIDNIKFYYDTLVSFSKEFVKTERDVEGEYIEKFSLNRLTGDFLRVLNFKSGSTYTTNYICSQFNKKLF